jgi:CheY-like chemotaxis protein
MHTDVLIIDDSELIVQMLTMVCEGAGYRVRSCTAFSRVEQALTDAVPDVIVSDLNLPDVPGHDTIAALEALLAGRACPIIIISGQPRATLEALATARGLAGALSKDDGLAAIATQLPAMIEAVIASA